MKHDTLLCVQERLNVGAIDAVSAALRAALEEEQEALTEDVEYLQALLQDEAERQVRKCGFDAPRVSHNSEP